MSSSSRWTTTSSSETKGSECHYCERTDDLVEQISGLWFCFWCVERAREKGAWYWRQIYRALHPD
jgi:ribosomal protein L37AE/L43A